jgi:hypothetical protein
MSRYHFHLKQLRPHWLEGVCQMGQNHSSDCLSSLEHEAEFSSSKASGTLSEAPRSSRKEHGRGIQRGDNIDGHRMALGFSSYDC